MFPLAEGIWYAPRPGASSIYVLFYVDCGSRCDPERAEGLTHFLEHVLFKGAHGLGGRTLFERVERYGGELNAFTTKDKLALEAKVPPEGLRSALAVLRWLYEEAALAPHAIEKERRVILEELAMYEDIPEEALLDHFEEIIFTAGGLRHPIIGYRETLETIEAEQLQTYYRAIFQRSRWVLLIGGGLSFRDVERALAQTGWLHVVRPQVRLWQANEQVSAPQVNVQRRKVQQAHLVLGGVGPSSYAPEGQALQFILQALAGPHFSSRLNMILRERYGWCYTLYSFWHVYPECSVWGIYVGLAASAYERALAILEKELDRWITQPLTEPEGRRWRQQLIGRHLLSWENLIYRLQVQGRWLLDRDATFDVQVWAKSMRALSPVVIQATAAACLVSRWQAALLPE